MGHSTDGVRHRQSGACGLADAPIPTIRAPHDASPGLDRRVDLTSRRWPTGRFDRPGHVHSPWGQGARCRAERRFQGSNPRDRERRPMTVFARPLGQRLGRDLADRQQLFGRFVLQRRRGVLVFAELQRLHRIAAWPDRRLWWTCCGPGGAARCHRLVGVDATSRRGSVLLNARRGIDRLSNEILVLLVRRRAVLHWLRRVRRCCLLEDSTRLHMRGDNLRIGQVQLDKSVAGSGAGDGAPPPPSMLMIRPLIWPAWPSSARTSRVRQPQMNDRKSAPHNRCSLFFAWQTTHPGQRDVFLNGRLSWDAVLTIPVHPCAPAGRPSRRGRAENWGVGCPYGKPRYCKAGR